MSRFLVLTSPLDRRRTWQFNTCTDTTSLHVNQGRERSWRSADSCTMIYWDTIPTPIFRYSITKLLFQNMARIFHVSRIRLSIGWSSDFGIFSDLVVKIWNSIYQTAVQYSHKNLVSWLRQRTSCITSSNSRNYIFIMPSGTNSQGNSYNTPGGSNSGQGSSYHCKLSLLVPSNLFLMETSKHCNSLFLSLLRMVFAYRLQHERKLLLLER
jgi:hypothetical protein